MENNHQKEKIQQAKIIKHEPIASGKWLKLTGVRYQDETGKERVWETIERTTHGKNREVDAVEILAILKFKNKPSQIVVLKQFRPPTGKYMIELPAGLVDENEQITTAALRELKEETGYTGKVVHESNPFLLGMAVSSTTSKLVTVIIDGDDEKNQNPEKELDEGEFNDVILLPLETAEEDLSRLAKEGCGIDGKILLLAFGLNNLPKLIS